jgi:hypothetical protein
MAFAESYANIGISPHLRNIELSCIKMKFFAILCSKFYVNVLVFVLHQMCFLNCFLKGWNFGSILFVIFKV